MGRTMKSTLMLIILVIIGGIFGALIGQALGEYFPFLKMGQPVGFQPVTINLVVLTITLGIQLQLTIASIIGFFIALFIYLRL